MSVGRPVVNLRHTLPINSFIDLTVIRILQLFSEFLFKLGFSALEEHKRIALIGAIQNN